MHFSVFICVLDADVNLNFFITLLSHNKIVLYDKIAYLIIPAAHTLVDCVVHGEAYKLDVLLRYKCYCIVILYVLKVVHLEGLTRFSAGKSGKNLVPFFAEQTKQSKLMFIITSQLRNQTPVR